MEVDFKLGQCTSLSSMSSLSLLRPACVSLRSTCLHNNSSRPLSSIPHIAQIFFSGATRRRSSSSVPFLVQRRTSTSCPFSQPLQQQHTSKRLPVTWAKMGCSKGLQGKVTSFSAYPDLQEIEGEMEYSQDQLPEGAIELHDAVAFSNVANEKGLISICGFGSLLSEKSARYTFPNLLDFRVAVLPGVRRVFAHVAPVFLERGIANVATKEMSSLSVEPFSDECIIVTVFEISIAEVPAFIEREHEFRFLAVPLFSLLGESLSIKAVVCARYSDEEYRQYRCQDNEEYQRRYGRFNIEKIWRDDILPCRVYLRHCVLAAKNLGQDAYDSFLDHTYLGDRITTIRQHLTNDEQIMLEEPPPSLRERYGG